MAENLVKKVGECGQDNLIAGLFPRALTMGIKVAAGEGLLPRGAVLAMNEDGTYGLYGKAAPVTLDEEDNGDGKTPSEGDDAAKTADSVIPSAILLGAVDASGDEAVTAVAYYCGKFNRNALITGEGYTLTASDRDALRKYNIVLSDMLDD